MDCDGAGKFETAWSRQLKSGSVDWLRFEYEKRQRSIQIFQTKLTALNHQLDKLSKDFQYWLNSENVEGFRQYSERYYHTLPRKVSDCSKEIAVAEKEMREIEQVLKTKWR